MPVSMKKNYFLANTKNKQHFIHMLSCCLQETNCKTFLGEGDADLLIVQTAIKLADKISVGDDTDLLVLFGTFVLPREIRCT